MASTFQVTRVSRRDDGGTPTQWEGVTDDCRGVYARYGGGELTVYLGDPDEGPEAAELNGRLILLKVIELNDPSAGLMTLGELKIHTAGLVSWPDEETPPDDPE